MPFGGWLALKLLALKLDLSLVFLTRQIEPAAADELNDCTQFVAIEPGAMSPAHIDNHTRATCEVNSIHQVLALRTRNVTDGFGLAVSFRLMSWSDGSASQHNRLLLAIGANPVKHCDLNPQAAAPLAFAHGLAANGDRSHVALAARAF